MSNKAAFPSSLFLEYVMKILTVLENASKPIVLCSDVNLVLEKTEKIPIANNLLNRIN